METKQRTAITPARSHAVKPHRADDALRLGAPSPLEPFFAPKSIAVLGATERPGSVGSALMRNLVPFGGRVFPINPKHDSVHGRKAFPNISSVPEPVDLAVIATPAATVPGLIRECAEFGVPAALILSAGFKEIGKEGAELEQQILKEARRTRLRVIGPNCLGLMAPHTRLNVTFGSGMATEGNLAFISQSGALCTAILDWSFREHVGFSAFVSVGSMLDVGWGDLITHLGNDPRTKSIVMYMESVGDARSFLSAAREVALSKPIVVLKVGRTQAASKAAASHTGSLTGSDAVLDTAFRRVGVLRVDTLGELFDMAEVLAKQPRPKGPALSIVTNAGGPGALATDTLTTSGGRLAELTSEASRALDEFLPPYWSHGNPIDILGAAGPEDYVRAVEIAAASPKSDGVLVILTPQAMTDAASTAEGLRTVAQRIDKPILASWMGGPSVEPGKAILNAAGIPTFDFPDTAARAFALMWRYSDNLRLLYETPVDLEPLADPAPDPAKAGELIDAAKRAGRTLLTEVEAKQVLAAYGIPIVETFVAKSEEEAVHLSEKVGFPVVIKLYSETLTHKSDYGGVHLNIEDADGVRRAWRSIQQTVAEKAGAAAFQGATVQKMVFHNGYELILGSSVDPQFGPVLLFGAGGRLVEVFKDRALGLPPLNATLARRLMEQTRIWQALQGVRGQKQVDLRALEQCVVRFAQILSDQPWISEIEINPLIVAPDRVIALDARAVLHPLDTPKNRLPKPAIRPYPGQYVTSVKLKDGTPIVIRPIRPEDEARMLTFHQTLSEQSVYYRYFTPLPFEVRVAHERLSRLCFIDYDREMALVAEHRNMETGRREIIGVARLTRLQGSTDEAEFALIISDPWQNRGIGTLLLNNLVQVARNERIKRIRAITLAENKAMQLVAQKAGFQVSSIPGEPERLLELRL